jgi:hypothetical protein
MKSVSLGIALLAVALSPLGCRNPFADQSVVLMVSNLEAPFASVPGTPVTVVLTVGANGCERFEHISQMVVNSDVVLAAVGTNAALGRKDISCPASFTIGVHSVVIEEPPSPPFRVVVVQPRGVQPLYADVALGVVMD